MIVAVHQPNHLPWAGYFAKAARASVFVFLDDVQFSKGSYTNRVQVAGPDGTTRWLTAPIRHAFGAPIAQIAFARVDWARAHRERLLQLYREASAFRTVWPEIESWLLAPQPEWLSEANETLIRKLAARLGVAPHWVRASDIGIVATDASERLARLVAALAPGGTYLSGRGGTGYQDEAVFRRFGIHVMVSDFVPKPYARSGHGFVPGLSILDAVFHLGWNGAAALIAPR